MQEVGADMLEFTQLCLVAVRQKGNIVSKLDK